MRGKSLALLMLALGCGLVASIGITQVMAKRSTEPAATGDTQSVLVVVKDVGVGGTLSSADVRLEQWPKDKAPAGALARVEDAEGRRLRTKFFAGEPVLDNKLLPRGIGPGAAGTIPKGYRVIPVKVDNVSGGSLILPGDRVDVLVHLSYNPSRGITETTTRTILQDIKVFAVNEVVSLDTTEQDGASKSINAKTISLLVTPSQAEMVTLASELGKIRLVMRSPEDDAVAKVGGAVPSDMAGKTDAGRREKESLLEKPASGSKKEPDGFLQFLNAMRSKPAAGKAPPAEAEPEHVPGASWTMRILQPGAINDVVLETEVCQSASDAGPLFEFWRANGLKTPAVSKPSKPSAKPDEAPAEPEAEAAKPVPEKPAKPKTD